MTRAKPQTEQVPGRKFDRQQVVAAGLVVLDRFGLDGFTMRRVADELGVQVNTLYWHARSKSSLLDLMADDLLRGCTHQPLPKDWADRVRALGSRYRQALLSHRDGGRVSIARFNTLPHTRVLIEEVHRAFVDSGLPFQLAAHGAWQLSFLTLASVIEEQGQASVEDDTVLENWPAIAGPDRLAETLRYSVSVDHETRYRTGVEILIAGVIAMGGRTAEV